ncbi:enoyl-CoA hydratase [Mycobacterium sp. OTB74]|uniref:enoyl-CoA hydratase n=1 Tax=Mycobacterium sp. OTB74 TaxID=1853452 RepID=UPI0024740BF9|nr:enoyl-CoA hydratase [Mycobacterium sp. OTB74]MDH6246527.1 enoyl-CoA hydratase [Mycobacterium sp. OTB74]
MSDSPDQLRIENHGAIRVLTIDRPEAKNALHGPLRTALRRAMWEADNDGTVAAVVLTGVDPVFSAGVDFKQLERGSDETGNPLDPTPAAVIRAIRTPVICAVNGACVSGALELALSCSFIVASDQARFADTHALLGVVPTWGLTALLPRAVGVRKAREMSITGAFLDADEALRIGLVNHVVPHDQLLSFTLSLAARIPSNNAVGEMLNFYRQGQNLTLSGALTLETEASIGRTYDLTAFTEAGRRISR